MPLVCVNRAGPHGAGAAGCDLVVTRVGRGGDGADWAIVGNFVSKISFGSNFCAKAIEVTGRWAIMGDEWISLRLE